MKEKYMQEIKKLEKIEHKQELAKERKKKEIQERILNLKNFTKLPSTNNSKKVMAKNESLEIQKCFLFRKLHTKNYISEKNLRNYNMNQPKDVSHQKYLELQMKSSSKERVISEEDNSYQVHEFQGQSNFIYPNNEGQYKVSHFMPVINSKQQFEDNIEKKLENLTSIFAANASKSKTPLLSNQSQKIQHALENLITQSHTRIPLQKTVSEIKSPTIKMKFPKDFFGKDKVINS